MKIYNENDEVSFETIQEGWFCCGGVVLEEGDRCAVCGQKWEPDPGDILEVCDEE